MIRSVDLRHALVLVVALSSSAWADDQEVLAPPPPPPAEGTRPVYTAPLSQTTQSTYVPQSVALSGPEEIDDFDKNRPIPDGYTAVQRPRKGLLIGGSVTLGVVYGISLLSAAIGEDLKGDGKNDAAPMAIPVAGPFLTMANTDSATLKVFLGAMGAAQLAGAVMLYYGLTTKKTVLVRNDVVGGLQISPMVAGGANSDASGLVLSGRF